MKATLLITCALFFLLNVHAQINMADSTVQVLGYWDKNEKHTYEVINERIKVKENDTISRESYKCKVDVTIIDSTANSYTVNWFYYDYDMSGSPVLQRIMSSISKNMNVTFTTDELGSFQKIVNWDEIQKNVSEVMVAIKEEFKDIPLSEQIISQVEKMFATRESFEAVAINEILLFYTFHGAQYKLGEEYTNTIQLPNAIGENPFDAELTVWLDEINPDDNDFVLRYVQEIDEEQLKKATFDYLVKLAEATNMPAPKLEEIPALSNKYYVGSLIHSSGWVIYLSGRKEVTGNDSTQIETTIIDLQ